MEILSKKKRALINECVALKEKLFKAGLYGSGQKMDSVLKILGFEVVGDLNGYYRYIKLLKD